jgi:hypothetical protein
VAPYSKVAHQLREWSRDTGSIPPDKLVELADRLEETDAGTAELYPIEPEDDIPEVLRVIQANLNSALLHPGNLVYASQQILKELALWKKNVTTVPLSSFALDKNATPKEIWDVIDKATDEESAHPASLRTIFVGITDPILTWYQSSRPASRTSSKSVKSPKRVAFEQIRTPSPTPELEIQSPQPKTPFSLPRPETPDRPITPNTAEWNQIPYDRQEEIRDAYAARYRDSTESAEELLSFIREDRDKRTKDPFRK